MAEEQKEKQKEQQSEKQVRNTYLQYLFLRMRASVRRQVNPYIKKLRRARLLRRERYIFTDKRHPEKGIFATVMGLLALFGLFLAVKLTFEGGGTAGINCVMAVLLSFVIALCGFIAGIIARKERDIFTLFPNLGILFNTLSLMICIGIFSIGVFY